MAFRIFSRKAKVVPPAVPIQVTSGFDDSDIQEFHLHYTERAQPDRGGGLNFSYDTYGLPINDIAGAFMVPARKFSILGPPPSRYFQQAPITNTGGTFAGSFVNQPLLDPNAPGSGLDYSGDFIMPDPTEYTGD